MVERAAGTPSEPQGREPTAADAVIVGQAVATDLHTQNPATTADRERVASDAIRNEARRLNLQISPEERRELAGVFIGELEARGAFRQQEQQAQQGGPAGTAGSPPEGAESGAQTATRAPEKRTLAQRLLGS